MILNASYSFDVASQTRCQVTGENSPISIKALRLDQTFLTTLICLYFRNIRILGEEWQASDDGVARRSVVA
jgi:hypothetical protein